MTYKSFGFTDHQLMIRDAIIGLMERELPRKAGSGCPIRRSLAAPMRPIRIWRYSSRR
jgi:hypothetical protein